MKRVKLFWSSFSGEYAILTLNTCCNQFLDSGHYQAENISITCNEYGWVLALIYIEDSDNNSVKSL